MFEYLGVSLHFSHVALIFGIVASIFGIAALAALAASPSNHHLFGYLGIFLQFLSLISWHFSPVFIIVSIVVSRLSCHIAEIDAAAAVIDSSADEVFVVLVVFDCVAATAVGAVGASSWCYRCHVVALLDSPELEMAVSSSSNDFPDFSIFFHSGEDAVIFISLFTQLKLLNLFFFTLQFC